MKVTINSVEQQLVELNDVKDAVLCEIVQDNISNCSTLHKGDILLINRHRIIKLSQLDDIWDRRHTLYKGIKVRVLGKEECVTLSND